LYTIKNYNIQNIRLTLVKILPFSNQLPTKIRRSQGSPQISAGKNAPNFARVAPTHTNKLIKLIAVERSSHLPQLVGARGWGIMEEGVNISVASWQL